MPYTWLSVLLLIAVAVTIQMNLKITKKYLQDYEESNDEKIENVRGLENEKKIRNRTAYIITAICLLAAGVLLCHILFEFRGIRGQGTSIEFNVNNPVGLGFNRDVTVYTENGTTRVAFSGKITPS